MIANNRKVLFDYFIESKYEAGIVLLGWEVKSIRAGRVQLLDSYVVSKQGELWLLGSNISPLLTSSTHVHTDARRTRKLLLHSKEISKLSGKVNSKGYTLVVTDLHYKHGLVKATVALAKGKNKRDKKQVLKERDLKREAIADMKNFK